MKTLKILFGIFLIAFFAGSCIQKGESLGDAGQTLVKLYPADYSMTAFDAKTTAQAAVLFEVRRDAAGNSDLNSSTTVDLLYDVDNSILSQYNVDYETSYIPLPTTLGTVSPAISGGKITLTFEPGEFVKTININVPSAASFDFSKNYALAFKINSVSGVGVLSEASGKTVVCEILAKNKYDGTYMMKGYIMRHGDTGGLEGYFSNHKKTLSTTGASSVIMAPNQLWANGGGVGGIGSWTIKVDESGTPPYKITVTDPVAVNWLMDPTYPNRYDPTTKTFYFKVNWGATIPYIRGCVDTLVYVGAR